MAGGITALQKLAEQARDEFALFVALYKDPAATGYDPRDDRDAATLAAMVGGAGFDTVEFNGTNYARTTLTFADGGSGVTLDTAAIAAQLIADAESIASLGASADLYGGSPIGVGGMILCGEDAGASDDGDRWMVVPIPYHAVRYPDGGDFDLVWPNTGVLILR